MKRTSILNDDGMVALRTRNVIGSLLEVSLDSIKPTKRIAEQGSSY